MIFDEVITGFGRTGNPFGANTYEVQPDMITMAKAMTNGAIPMSAVGVGEHIYKTIIDAAPEQGVDFFHGYTYSGHPAACAAGLATLDIFEQEDMFGRAKALSNPFLDRFFDLKDLPIVTNMRGVGLLAAIDLAPDSAPGTRGYQAVMDLYDKGVLVKVTGDTVMLSPAFICEESDLDRIFETLRGCVVGLLGLSWFNLDSDRCSRAYTRERLNIVERPTPNITGTGGRISSPWLMGVGPNPIAIASPSGQ